MAKEKNATDIANQIKRSYEVGLVEGITIRANIIPFTTRDITPEEENLDALARLCTGPETCAAVCYDNIGGKLLIASNKGTPQYAPEYMKSLSAFANNPTQTNYDALEKAAHFSVKLIVSNLQTTTKIKSDFSEQQKSIGQNKTDQSYCELVEAIARGNNEILNESKITSYATDAQYSFDTKRLALKILRPIIDTRNMARAIVTREGIESVVLDAIKAGPKQMQYVSGRDSVHAEMKIIDHVKQSNYIGISKLACCPCAITLDQFRSRFAGSHGGTYRGWEPPDLLTSDSRATEVFLKRLDVPDYYTKGVETRAYSGVFPPRLNMAEYSRLQQQMDQNGGKGSGTPGEATGRGIEESQMPFLSQRISGRKICVWGNGLFHKSHLKRAGKEAGEDYDIREFFAATNSNPELLSKISNAAIITADIDLKAISVKEDVDPDKVGKVEFLDEKHHIQNHAQNTQFLIDGIESGNIGQDTVIAIERKSYGKNLGVADVIMLASVIEHNQKNPDRQLQIPEEIIKESLLYSPPFKISKRTIFWHNRINFENQIRNSYRFLVNFVKFV